MELVIINKNENRIAQIINWPNKAPGNKKSTVSNAKDYFSNEFPESDYSYVKVSELDKPITELKKGDKVSNGKVTRDTVKRYKYHLANETTIGEEKVYTNKEFVNLSSDIPKSEVESKFGKKVIDKQVFTIPSSAWKNFKNRE